MTRLNIRWKLTLWNTAAFTLVLAVFGGLVYYWLREMHLDVVAARLQRELGVVSEELAPTSIHQWARRAEENPELRTAIWDANGQLVAGDEEFASALPARLRSEWTTFTTVGLTGLGRFGVSTKEANGHFVLLAMDLHHVDEEMTQVRDALTITLPFALAVASILAYVLAKRTLAPVDTIRRQAEAITASRLDERVPVTNPHDELGQLAHTLNDMIARLQKSFEEVRRFTADASHELRTPLAIIRSDAEIGLSENGCEAHVRKRFVSILEETQRLTHLTEQLLLLCREDAGIVRAGMCEFNLVRLVEDVVQSLRPLAGAKDQTLDLAIETECNVRGDPARLRQAFSNLVDNACKYSPLGGQIQIRITSDSDNVAVTVEDSGPGVETGERHLIFSRFFRGKASAFGETGAGLGLSIVKSAIESHGGRVEVENTRDNGALFRVLVPRVRKN